MRTRRLDLRLAALEGQLERIEGMLLLKDPGAARAAEAYDGLRRQMLVAANERTAHLAHLAQLDAALRAGESTGSLALLVADLLAQAGLVRHHDTATEDAFDVGSGPDGGPLEVLEPAYVDGHTGRVVRQGRARRVVRRAPPDLDLSRQEAAAARPAPSGRR